MARNTWRDSARPIIAQVLSDNIGKSQSEIRQALKDAYPFGQRKYHPYKVWLHEIQVQVKKKRLGVKYKPVPKEQLSLFK